MNYGNSPVIFIVCNRKYGMSTKIKQIIQTIDLPIGIAISPIEEDEKFYSSFMDNIYKYDKYEDDIIKNVFKRQRILLENSVCQTKDIRMFVALDSCFYDNKWSTSLSLMNLFTSNRSHHITTIFGISYFSKIMPRIVSCIDILIIGKISFSELKRIYENFNLESNYNISFEEFQTNYYKCDFDKFEFYELNLNNHKVF
jgi:hypothetical protein